MHWSGSRRIARAVTAFLLAAQVVVSGCSGTVSRPERENSADAASAVESSGPPAETGNPGDSGGLPRWAWITIGSVAAVAVVTGVAIAVLANNSDGIGFRPGDDFPCGRNGENCGGDPVPSVETAQAR